MTETILRPCSGFFQCSNQKYSQNRCEWTMITRPKWPWPLLFFLSPTIYSSGSATLFLFLCISFRIRESSQSNTRVSQSSSQPEQQEAPQAHTPPPPRVRSPTVPSAASFLKPRFSSLPRSREFTPSIDTQPTSFVPTRIHRQHGSEPPAADISQSKHNPAEHKSQRIPQHILLAPHCSSGTTS